MLRAPYRLIACEIEVEVRSTHHRTLVIGTPMVCLCNDHQIRRPRFHITLRKIIESPFYRLHFLVLDRIFWKSIETFDPLIPHPARRFDRDQRLDVPAWIPLSGGRKEQTSEDTCPATWLDNRQWTLAGKGVVDLGHCVGGIRRSGPVILQGSALLFLPQSSR